MKKLIGFLLSFILVFSSIILCVQKPLKVKAEEALINSFVNDTLEMIKENDKDKKFIPDDESETATLSTQSFDDSTNNVFQTCRLIVQAEKEIEKLNSTAVASGFMDYYIVQFETEEDAENAYEYYSTCDYVESVSPDGVYSAISDFIVDSNNYITYDNDVPDSLEFWGSEVTGTYELKKYIENNYSFENLEEIKVAMIDTGVDYNNNFIKNRLIRTYFSAIPDDEDEYDDVQGHGTMTSSVVVDNSPDNIKVAVYKVMNSDGLTTVSYSVLGILQAVSDRADIINMSFGLTGLTEANLAFLENSLETAHNKGCILTASAGNQNINVLLANRGPGGMDCALTVGASSEFNMPTSWSSHGKTVDLIAPGSNVPVATLDNKYIISNGTSFSAPLVASVCAMLMILYPTETNKQIEHRIRGAATPNDAYAVEDLYGYGIVDAIGAADIDRVDMPTLSVSSGLYAGKTQVSIQANEDCEIYYTLNQTYPTKESGILYTEPFTLEDDLFFIHVVAYKDGKSFSRLVSELVKVATVGTDDMFEIESSGVITSYHGDANYLMIPEKISGITVTGLAESLFTEAVLYGLSLPETIDTIPANLFYNNANLVFVEGEGVKQVNEQAFYYCKNLWEADFPNVETIGTKAFYYTRSLSEISFPKCTYLGSEAFGYSTIRNINLPSVEIIHYRSFYKCACIYNLNVPNLMELRHKNYTSSGWIGGNYAFRESNICGVINFEKIEQVPYGTFFDANVKRLEFSNATTIGTLPIRYCRKPVFGTVSVVLPSTLKSCDIDIIPYDEQEDGIEYQIKFKVYGSKGTYAEQWATDNGYKFIEITPDNAVITDIPDEYYSYMRPLEADVVGFNRTYQWYGSDENNYSNGVAIKGATSREFNPNDFRSYKYYYCEVISTDVGYDPIKIKTGICENKSYRPYIYTPEKYDASIKIQTSETRYLEYGESITLYASSTGLPDGAKIRWRVVDGTGITLNPSFSGKYCDVTSKSNGNVIIEAYAVDKQGNTIYIENGKRVYDREGISSEVTLWMIIVDYFKKIFPFIRTTFNNLI